MATLVIRGLGSPEGFIEAARGTFYINTQSSSTFVKIKGEATNSKGWKVVNSKGYYENEGNPENVVSANKYAMCFDTTNNNLYMQTVYGNPASNTGWISVNLGRLFEANGDPNILQFVGLKGDIYIDLETFNIYLKTDTIWEQIPLMESDSSEILIKLSELLTNSTGVVNQYFNMFFNPNPMDVELSQYNTDGILKVYKIPNRAKDTFTLVGEGSPEGAIYAVRGKMYLDVISGTPYIKKTIESSNTGWVPLKAPDVAEPLKYEELTNILKIETDASPTAYSINMINSGVIYDELAKIRNGSQYEVFAVAEPVEEYHATPKSYVDEALNGMFEYNANTHTISIHSPLVNPITEAGTVVGKAGNFYTPAYGSAYSTKFTFTSPWTESEGYTNVMHSDIPCRVLIHTEPYQKIVDDEPVTVEFEYNIEFTAQNKDIRPFTDEMEAGIRYIKVTSSTEYDYPTINIVKDIYRDFTTTAVPRPTTNSEE